MADDEPKKDQNASELPNRNVLVLYGSETGNCQDLAEDLERLCERLHFDARVYEMNDVELSSLSQYLLVIFVISTTGQGEFPKNSQRFWKSLLRRRIPPTYLSNVRFTTFGLGDSSYFKYNWAARKLHKRLEQIGAVEFYPRGEADERHDEGIEGTYLPWSLSLRTHLLSEHPHPQGLPPIPSDIPLPLRYTLYFESTMDPPTGAMSDHGLANSSIGAADNEPALTFDDDDITTPPGHFQYQDSLDETAARFSHVDAINPKEEENQLKMERLKPTGGIGAHAARESEHTGSLIPGGIDTLDRPNVIRDAVSKYSLEDPQTEGETPPPQDLLPIPDGWTATLVENTRVTPEDHWQDVRLLSMTVHRDLERPEKDQFLLYKPGDVVVLYPKNFPEDVQALIDRMGWADVADKPWIRHKDRKDRFVFNPAPKSCYPLKNTTLRQLLTHNYDITAIPKRLFFDYIRHFTDDLMHRERLEEFSDPRFTDEFFDYTSRPRRSILEVLQEFSTVKIPWESAPSIFPIMRGRQYSIASGGVLTKDPLTRDTRIELLIALVKYKTVLRKTRKGLCSRYIETLREGTEIRIGVESHIGPPTELKYIRLPVLAIAPGTGVAPIRAFFHDRASDDEPRGKEVLFFGGRKHEADFYFKDEWRAIGIEVHGAFSRDQREKIYVQDVIRREAKLVCSLLRQGAIVCICGSSGKMPEAVRAALEDALILGGLVLDREAATKVIENKKKDIWWEELW